MLCSKMAEIMAMAMKYHQTYYGNASTNKAKQHFFKPAFVTK